VAIIEAIRRTVVAYAGVVITFACSCIRGHPCDDSIKIGLVCTAERWLGGVLAITSSVNRCLCLCNEWSETQQ